MPTARTLAGSRKYLVQPLQRRRHDNVLQEPSSPAASASTARALSNAPARRWSAGVPAWVGWAEALSELGLAKLEAVRDGGGECAFPELRRLQTRGCSRLRRIPMRPASGQGKVRVEADKHWWNGLQWAGDDVKSCFVPVLL